MENRENDRSGLQTAADLTRLAKEAANIARAAASSGVYGAAAAAAQEAAPFITKIVLCPLIFIIVSTMVVFSAIPSIFFGYDTSREESIVEMTRLAGNIGSVCMSLEEFENTVIDAIVTSIAADYEEQGVQLTILK